MSGQWVTIDVKVAPAPGAEYEDEFRVSPSEVAAEIRQRLEDLDLDTGWVITKVSAGTQFYPQSVMEQP